MKISIIVATARNNVIGQNGKIPWHITEDLKHFKEITINHHVLMGRKTHESIGRSLPNRTNLILTTNNLYQSANCHIFTKLQEALDFARKNEEEELIVIGGEQIYKLTLPIVEKIYMTKVLEDFRGDTHFPEINPEEWIEVYNKLHKESNPPFEYRNLERRG